MWYYRIRIDFTNFVICTFHCELLKLVNLVKQLKVKFIRKTCHFFLLFINICSSTCYKKVTLLFRRSAKQSQKIWSMPSPSTRAQTKRLKMALEISLMASKGRPLLPQGIVFSPPSDVPWGRPLCLVTSFLAYLFLQMLTRLFSLHRNVSFSSPNSITQRSSKTVLVFCTRRIGMAGLLTGPPTADYISGTLQFYCSECLVGAGAERIRLETLIGNLLGSVFVPEDLGCQLRFSLGASDKHVLHSSIHPSIPYTGSR